MDPACKQSAMQAYVMVWGCFVEVHKELESVLTGVIYMDLVANHLHLFMLAMLSSSESLSDFNGTSTHQGLFYAKRLGNYIFIFTFFVSLFLKLYIKYPNLIWRIFK